MEDQIGVAQSFHDKPQNREHEPNGNNEFMDLAGPKFVMDKLLSSEKIRNTLNREGRAYIEVGSKENPSHAFRLAIVGNEDSEGNLSEVDENVQEELMDELMNYFHNNEDVGFLFATRGDAVVGVTNPTGEVPIEQVVTQLHLMQSKLQQEIVGDKGRVVMVISEFDELALSVTEVSQHLPLDASQSAGLTHISWTESKWRSDPNFRRQVGDMVWVSSNKNDILRQKLVEMGHSPSDQLLYSHLGEVAPFSPKKAEKARVNARRISLPEDKIEEYSFAYNSRVKSEKRSDLRTDLVDEYAVSSLPSKEFLNQHVPDWVQQMKEKGKVEWDVTGAHTLVKFDVSGLSAMVADGENPSEFISRVLAEFAAPAEEVFGKDSYLLQMEGDALVMFVPKDQSQTVEMIHRFVELSERGGHQLIRHIDKAARDSEIANVGEDRLGMKRVFTLIDNEKTKITFFKGGLTSIKNANVNKNEAQAESLAKQGGKDTVIVLDRPLEHDELIAAFGGRKVELNELKGRSVTTEAYAYSVEVASTPLEQRFADYISKGNHSELDQVFKEAKYLIGELNENSPVKESNINLALARIIYTMRSVNANWDEIIKSSFQERTSALILKLYESDSDFVPDVAQEKTVFDIVKRMNEIRLPS